MSSNQTRRICVHRSLSLMLHFNASLIQRGPGSPARPGKLFRIFSLSCLARLHSTMHRCAWILCASSICLVDIFGLFFVLFF